MLHSFVWVWHTWTARARGDLATARAQGEAVVRLGEALGHRTIRGHAHAVLGRVELDQGRVADAFAHFAAALPLHLDLRDGWGIMLDFEGFAAVATARGHYADAARLLGASDVLRERTIFAIPATERAEREARLALLRERLGAAELQRLLSEGGALSLDDVVALTADPSMAHTAEHPIVVSAHPGRGRRGTPAPARAGARPLQASVGAGRSSPRRGVRRGRASCWSTCCESPGDRAGGARHGLTRAARAAQRFT
jgi:hypothetical protein